jgi:hypothetical protein
MVALLDRREERIHIDMEDDAGHDGESKRKVTKKKELRGANSFLILVSPANLPRVSVP